MKEKIKKKKKPEFLYSTKLLHFWKHACQYEKPSSKSVDFFLPCVSDGG